MANYTAIVFGINKFSYSLKVKNIKYKKYENHTKYTFSKEWIKINRNILEFLYDSNKDISNANKMSLCDLDMFILTLIK